MNKVATKKDCLVCSLAIPINARKCTHCGTYQSFRRHFDFGNTSIALLIGFLGLLTTVPSTFLGIQTVLSKIFDAKIVARLVNIDKDAAILFVKNNGNREIIVSGLSCNLFFPIDSLFAFRDTFSATSQHDEVAEPMKLKAKDVINPILVTYEVEPTLLESGESAVMHLLYTDSGIYQPRVDSDVAVSSGCFLDVGRDRELQEVLIVVPDEKFVIDFGLRELISKSTVLREAMTSKEDLLKAIIGYGDAQQQ